MKSENKLAGLGVLTAISASLCCIMPVLALLAGTSGVASTLSWLDPFRPYLIGLTVLILGIAWFQKYKSKGKVDCNCESTENKTFIQTKTFLSIVTVFTVLMLAFPIYADVFYPESEPLKHIPATKNIQETEFEISGMTCSGCEEHISHELNKLSGVLEMTVSYKSGNAIVKFDQTQTNRNEIGYTIEKTGYSITKIR